jgi:hypothetical protein
VFGRKQAQQMRSHGQQGMSDLGESAVAFRRAAGHFAQGTAERLSPTYDRARIMAGRGLQSTRQTVSPMYRQMLEGKMNKRSMRRMKKEMAKRSRMRMLRGLLLTGAAVGAASAAVARRRRQQAEWAEYEPMGPMGGGYSESAYGPSARQKVAAGAASMVDSLTDRAGRIADSLHERSAGMPEKPGASSRDVGPSGTASTPMRDQSGPATSGPGPVLGSGTPNQPPLSTPRERLGDPALDFPDER